MNDPTATLAPDENADVEAATERVAEKIQRLAEAIQFAADLGLGFSWFYDGPAVLVTTSDEAIMRVLKEQGAGVRPYPPEAMSNPHKIAWELDLGRIGGPAKYIAICILDGEHLGADTSGLRERLTVVGEQVALEAEERRQREERERLEAEERQREEREKVEETEESPAA